MPRRVPPHVALLAGLALLLRTGEQPAAAAGRTFWLSPRGDDDAAGTKPDAPWRSMARALRALSPGDTLVLRDGVYTRVSTGLPTIDCGPRGNAANGASGRPITVRAEHERRAHLDSDGHQDALALVDCAYWRVEGLYGSNADGRDAEPWAGNVFRVTKGHDLVLRRLLAVRPNRTCPNGSLPYCNAHAIALEDTDRVLVEEAEVYDFHRHGISAFRSREVTLRRCYVNARDTPGAGGGPTGIILYGSADSTVENCIAEGTGGINVAGSDVHDGTRGGYRNRLLGLVTLDNRYGATLRARRFGDGPVLPVGDTTVRDSVFARTREVGLYARGAARTVLDHVTFWQTGDAAVAADEDRAEGAPCSGNPDGCSIAARNVLVLDGRGPAFQIDGRVVPDWKIERSVAARNRGGDWPTLDAAATSSPRVHECRSVAEVRRGLGDGQCLLWPPPGDPAPDAGATILYRWENGALGRAPLWDPRTGAFPCGAVVPGVNDAGRVCSTVHERLNVNANGCRFPPDYPGRAPAPPATARNAED